MKKLLALLTATAAFSLLPSVSQANCAATGEIPRVFVTAAGSVNIGVRLSNPGSTFFNFTTTAPSVINAALIAQSSHQRVVVVGNAAACGAVVGGLSAGGTVISITVAP